MSKKNGNLQVLEQSQTAKRANLAEWRSARTHELELPSGLTATVRDVDITDLALTGRIPNSLMDVFVSAAEQKSEADAEKMAGDAIAKNAADFGRMLDAVTRAAFVSPRIGDVADDETVTVDEIPMGDKLFLFNHLNREVARVRSFREGERERDHPA